MEHTKLIVALSMIVGASAGLATTPEPGATTGAPAGSALTKYCLHVEPVTGSLVETVQCWTRLDWAEQGVDVDKEWARNGVKIIA